MHQGVISINPAGGTLIYQLVDETLQSLDEVLRTRPLGRGGLYRMSLNSTQELFGVSGLDQRGTDQQSRSVSHAADVAKET